jgi:imidazolonepropionase
MATLGVSQLRMTPAEAIIAITANGAAAIGRSGDRGQLAPGFPADLTLAAVRDWRELVYWYGANLITGVWAMGAACHSGQGTIDFLG